MILAGVYVSRHALRDLLHISRDTLLAVLEPCASAMLISKVIKA